MELYVYAAIRLYGVDKEDVTLFKDTIIVIIIIINVKLFR